MSRYLSEEFCALLTGDINLGVFLRLDTDPALRLTLGVNDMPIGISSLDEDGAVYRGAGRLATIPELEAMINGLADEVEITLSGVSAAHLALVAAGAPTVTGVDMRIGIAPLSPAWQPLTAIVPLWQGYADVWGFNRTGPRSSGGSAVHSLVLHAQTGTPARSKQNMLTYSDEAQRQQNPVSGQPEDRFCERVVRYFAGYIVSWPRF